MKQIKQMKPFSYTDVLNGRQVKTRNGRNVYGLSMSRDGKRILGFIEDVNAETDRIYIWEFNG